jgi:peptidoglycan/LPS O-acetylase OafA/YrhL
LNRIETKNYYTNLDFLRAIAVLMTVFAHYSPVEIPYLWYGVSIFFSISGFLITEILLKKKEGEFDVLEILKNFYIRRSLRLFPLYYSFIFLFWALLHFANLHLWQDRFNYYFLFYAPNFLIAKISLGGAMGFAHLWSLGVEEQFYLLWPVILLLVPRKGILLTTLFFISVGIYFSTARFNTSMDMHLMPFSHFHTLCGGALIAVLKVYYNSMFLFIAQIRYKLLIIAFISLLYFLFFTDLTKISLSFFQAITLAFFTSVLVLYHLFPFYIKFTQNRFFSFLLYIGKISYGLYLIHMPIPYFIRAISTKILPNYHLHEYLVILISLIFSFIAASISHKYFESYFIKLKDKFE